MKKILLKFSGLVIFTSTLIGLMAGLFNAPQSALQTRNLQQRSMGTSRSGQTRRTHKSA